MKKLIKISVLTFLCSFPMSVLAATAPLNISVINDTSSTFQLVDVGGTNQGGFQLNQQFSAQSFDNLIVYYTAWVSGLGSPESTQLYFKQMNGNGLCQVSYYAYGIYYVFQGNRVSIRNLNVSGPCKAYVNNQDLQIEFTN